MVNTHLFASLLKALQNGCRLILVGDENQLESIEPGKVFADLIESNEIPVVRLENVYRQRQGSGIPLLARQIAKELPLEYSPEAAIHDVTEDKAVDTLLSIVENSPFPEDLHILAPKYEGKAEVDEINYILQQKLNPEDIKTKPQIASNRDIKLGDQKIRMHFRLGDKVMLIKNNPELKVYNGDIGIIEDVDVRNKALTVCFDNETRVEFQGEMLQELRHAWCTTVHKAQGQEYAHVIVMAPRNSFSMQKKRLLYTAITRAKKQLDIIGIRSDFEYNVKNKGIDNRHTSLQERIEQAKKAKDLLVFDDSEFIETEFDFDYNE
jgi:exodeoxyribonuclease V alpha subunit